MDPNDKGLRFLKNITGIVAIFYFFAPVLVAFLIKRAPTANGTSIRDKFLGLAIFKPIMHQYNIAVAKNNPMYYLAFYISLFLVCILCWVIAFYILKAIYRVFKRG